MTLAFFYALGAITGFLAGGAHCYRRFAGKFERAEAMARTQMKRADTACGERETARLHAREIEHRLQETAESRDRLCEELAAEKLKVRDLETRLRDLSDAAT